jgi:MoaA/NifB/PqqE/SkfB family radical SAM enzyme
MAPQTATSKPRLIFWELTKGCNLRCIHCRATATELSSPLDLPTAKARNIIEQIAGYASPILVLSGGEPLYRRDVFDLARFATDRGIRVALATNGTLVTRDVAQRIKDTGVKRVSISLDGADAETHDTFRAYSTWLWESEPTRCTRFFLCLSGAESISHRRRWSRRKSTRRCCTGSMTVRCKAALN